VTDLPTPLEPAPPRLAPSQDLWLKREDAHELGAFKWRGALPVLTAYRDAGAEGVVTASTGNHGAAAAWSAKRLCLRVVVFAPEDATRAKVELIESLGAELRLVGADFDQAKDAARHLAAAQGLPFFEDGAERLQYEGYGEIGREILAQMDEPPAVVVVPVGNGALFGGIGLQLAREAPETMRVGVAPKEAPVMVESWRAGRVVESARCATFADGLGVRIAIPLAVEVLADVADRMVLVSEREIATALGAFADAGIRVEGAAAAAFAAVSQLGDVEGPIVLVVTGRNIDDDLFVRATTRPESFPD
jgi:threonine dehydratase